MLEAAFTAAWCERQKVLGPKVLNRLLDPNPLPEVRVLAPAEAAKAAREHHELAAMFESLAASQKAKRDGGGK